MALIHDDFPTSKTDEFDSTEVRYAQVEQALRGAGRGPNQDAPLFGDPRYKAVNIAQERAQLRREIADLDIEAAQLAARKVALKSKLSELRQK